MVVALPDDWMNVTEVAVLTLMRWGLDNGVGGHLADPYSDQLMARINRMENWEPRRAMAFLTNPENGEKEEVLNAEMLAASATHREAAELLLENLHSAMVATRP